MSETVDYEAMSKGEKVRLVLRLQPEVKKALVGKAKALGVSPSAYVSLLVDRDLGAGGFAVG